MGIIKKKDKNENKSSECTHDCSSCGASCPSRQEKKPYDERFEMLPQGCNVKKVFAVMSGKGGVGKSLVTGLLATIASKCGYKVGIIDADITGPSIPKAFGLHGLLDGNKLGMRPMQTRDGIGVVSVNLLMENEKMPLVWRGPVIAGTVKQFWNETLWEDIDFMFIDMPPGTGDVPLTIFQSLPLDGVIIVTSPQDLVSLIVSKAANMAQMMNIPVIGLVENMSYVECPDCGKKIEVFGQSHINEIADEFGYAILGKIPFDMELARLVDAGKLEDAEKLYLYNAFEILQKAPSRREFEEIAAKNGNTKK